MKESDYPFEGIFNGLAPERVVKKTSEKFIQCHNLEPIEGDYDLHEFVVDMNTDSYAWGNA